MIPRYCYITPYHRDIEPSCRQQLRVLENLGVAPIEVPYCSEIGHARSELASAAILRGFDALIFIDSDIEFKPEDALRLLRRPEPVVAGLYPQKGRSVINADFPEDIKEIHCGATGRDYEVYHVGAGFLRVTAECLVTMIERLDMPECTFGGRTLWPFFLQSCAIERTGEWCYYGEDYSFCRRVRECGMKVICDTRPRLAHIGHYGYQFEEAGGQHIVRNPSVTLNHQPVRKSTDG